MVCHAPEHLIDAFGGLAVIATADITPHQYLAGIFGELDGR
jgi:hypothetical protein